MYIDIVTPVNVKIHGGQYINIWMPGLSVRSLCQTHPFVIASAHRDEAGVELKLVVILRRGWTVHLLQRALDAIQATQSYVVLFSGPHGLQSLSSIMALLCWQRRAVAF